MFILGLLLLINLHYQIILMLGVVIVGGHTLLDASEAAPGFQPSFWWDLFHHGFFAPYSFAPNHYAVIVYPFVPWAGLMMLGYCAGVFFTPAYTAGQRKKILLRTGLSMIGFFILLRFSNVYGDPFDWSNQKDGLYTSFSFLKVHKYPPSYSLFASLSGLH